MEVTVHPNLLTNRRFNLIYKRHPPEGSIILCFMNGQPSLSVRSSNFVLIILKNPVLLECTI